MRLGYYETGAKTSRCLILGFNEAEAHAPRIPCWDKLNSDSIHPPLQ